MAIPTSRTSEDGQISIDTTKCTGYRKCVEVCNAFTLTIENKKAKAVDNQIFGCYACGQCMAVCPEEAIAIDGRTLSSDDVFVLPPSENAADYNQLLTLLQLKWWNEYTNTQQTVYYHGG